MLLPAVCMISLPYVNSNWSYSPETVKLGVDLCDLDLWPLTLTFCMDITFDHGNNSWKFHDDTMMGTWWKRCDRRTDRRTDRQTENTICRAAWSQLKIFELWNWKVHCIIQGTHYSDVTRILWCIKSPITWFFNTFVGVTTSKYHSPFHYGDVIIGAIASQITSLTIVYSTVYSEADQRKHQSSASLAFVWRIHRGPVNSPHKWPVTRKMSPFDDVIMFWTNLPVTDGFTPELQHHQTQRISIWHNGRNFLSI